VAARLAGLPNHSLNVHETGAIGADDQDKDNSGQETACKRGRGEAGGKHDDSVTGIDWIYLGKVVIVPTVSCQVKHSALWYSENRNCQRGRDSREEGHYA
jgi:hypothetical protein